MVGEADAALARHHKDSARDLLLRASVFYAASYHLLYGMPVDDRLLKAFCKQSNALDWAWRSSMNPLSPYAFHSRKQACLLTWFLLSAMKMKFGPLIIFTNGYDGTVFSLWQS
jgi:hypothetical protein